MSELWGILAAVLVTASALLLMPGAGPTGRPLRGRLRLRRGRGSTQPDAAADAAMLLDLAAALLQAGVGIEAALIRLADAVPEAADLRRVHHALAAGAGWEQAAEQVRGDEQLSAVCEQLSFAHATGAPSASMLMAAAEQLRTARRHEAQRRAEELGVKMMLPLGVCFLPAFILLGVVPVVLSMLPEALGIPAGAVGIRASAVGIQPGAPGIHRR